MDDLEVFWSNILSRDAVKINAAWESLDSDEQTAVQAHLTRMATEDDWAEPQRLSAQAALDVLRDRNDPPSQ